jgi:uncharacterized protein YdbL (DUF1318 family)
MKILNRPKTISAIVLCLSLVAACVTINIYFPAEKVESVAGEIVNDIRGLKPGEADQPVPQKKDQSLLRRPTRLAQLGISPSPAFAEEATTVSNPAIRALKESMKARFKTLKPFYEKKMISEGKDGYLTAGNTAGLDLKGLRDLKGLVAAENRDREALYQEVARALKIDASQVGKVAEIFAKEWQKSVP